MAVMRDMMYRSEYLMGIVADLIQLVVELLTVKLIFVVTTQERIAGFDVYQMYFVLMITQLIWYFLFAFGFDSLWVMRYQIKHGLLDLMMLRPVSVFGQVFLQRMGLVNMVQVLIYALVILPYLASKFVEPIGYSDWLMIAWLIGQGLILFYLLYFVAMAVEFFWSDFNGLWDLFNFLSGVSKYPEKIYPQWMRFSLMFVYPLLLIASPVYLVFEKSMTWEILLMIFAVVVLNIFVARGVWWWGLKRYQSAA